MAIQQKLHFACDVCDLKVTVSLNQPDTEAAADGWLMVKRQAGKVVEDYVVCGGGCLRKMADTILEEKVGA